MRNGYLLQHVLGGILVFGMVTSNQAMADDSDQLKQQVQVLQDRVNQLENQLANKQQIPPTAVVSTPGLPVYDQWQDPLTQMMLMQEQMDRNFRQAFANTQVFNPRMDMKQTDKQYIITMDIPGMDKDKINIENKEGVLTISGERRSETDNNQNNQYYRQERSFGSFMQSIPLPEDAKTDQIDAKYKNGVLTVTMARLSKEEKKAQNQRITVN